MLEGPRNTFELKLPTRCENGDQLEELRQKIEELDKFEKTRIILDQLRHERQLEAAREEGWNAARLGAEVESDMRNLDCGEIPIHYIRFHYKDYQDWKRERELRSSEEK